MTQQEKAVEIVERLRRYVGLAKKGKLILGLNFCETLTGAADLIESHTRCQGEGKEEVTSYRDAPSVPSNMAETVKRLRAFLDAAGPHLPLRVEEDWTWEVYTADGLLIAKLPYPKPPAHTFAALFTDGINALPDILTALNAHPTPPSNWRPIAEIVERCAKGLEQLAEKWDAEDDPDYAAAMRMAAKHVRSLPPPVAEEAREPDTRGEGGEGAAPSVTPIARPSVPSDDSDHAE